MTMSGDEKRVQTRDQEQVVPAGFDVVRRNQCPGSFI
jgi:hypothetical protein